MIKGSRAVFDWLLSFHGLSRLDITSVVGLALGLPGVSHVGNAPDRRACWVVREDDAKFIIENPTELPANLKIGFFDSDDDQVGDIQHLLNSPFSMEPLFSLIEEWAAEAVGEVSDE